MNLFDIPVSEFHGICLATFTLCSGAAGALRWYCRAPALENLGAMPELDPYEAAVLSGGSARAVEGAVVALVDRGLAKLDASGEGLTLAPRAELPAYPGAPSSYRQPPPSDRGLHPVERALFCSLDPVSPLPLRLARAAVRDATDTIIGRLLEERLILDQGTSRHAMVLPLLVALVAPALVALRLAYGPERGGDATVLLVSLFIGLFIALLGFARPPRRSRAGDEMVAALEGRHGSLCAQGPELGGSEALLGVALFGAGVLAGGRMDPVAQSLRKEASRSSSGGGDGGGCSSSDGGGDGGGCGGCGGCGGGD